MPSPTGSALRALLALAGAALALAAWAEHRELRTARGEAFAWLERAGVDTDTAEISREADPQRVRLQAARTVLVAELNPSRHQGASPAETAREIAERMEASARAGREILARRPASWEAALVTGGATYLGWSQTRDPRLLTAYRQWEAPLEAALRLAPAKRDPVRFLAAAYLENWPALSPRKREVARVLLAEVFRDPEDLNRLIDPWLETAAGPQEAFSPVPDEPQAWERVEKAYAHRGDLAGFAAARGRYDAALFAALRRDLLEADRLRGDGRTQDARFLYLRVAEQARPEARYLPFLEEALDRCPPGPVDNQTSERLTPHLDRALDRCLFASCDLRPGALQRLSRLVHDPAPSRAAMASLFAGDLQRAAVYERRTEGLGTEEWAPYLIAKARTLAAGGRSDEAREALALVHLSFQRGPLYWRTRAEVARAAADPRDEAVSRARLAELSRGAWTAPDWTFRRGTARLEMLTAAPAGGFEVVLDSVPANGSLVELRLDGASVGVFPVRPLAGAAPALRRAVALAPGLHVLELDSPGGGQVLPGTTVLR